MKNPILIAARCFGVWRQLGAYPGVFPLPDAAKHLRVVLQPRRVTDWGLRRFINRELDIKSLPEGVHEIQFKSADLVFYWIGEPGCGMAGGILQEIEPTHPHYYTTPPVHLTPSSVVLDVGSCEGLFALRVTRKREVAQVICFEPAARTAAFLQQAAQRNGVADRIRVEVCAVGARSQDVYFTNLASPEANCVVAEGGAEATKTRQVSLDDYCQQNNLRLTARDLIKIDAEGADVDVLKGAERLIREGAPQIAVTTYHNPRHAATLIEYLRSLQPRYQLRLKGFTLFNTENKPRPVLLQAALPLSSTAS